MRNLIPLSFLCPVKHFLCSAEKWRQTIKHANLKSLHMHPNLCRSDVHVPAVYVLVCFNIAGFDHLFACFTPYF